MSLSSSLIPPPDVGGEGEVVASLVVNDLTADRLIYADSTKKLSSVANLASWVAGSNITVTDDLDGTITVSIPQSVATSASPTFVGATFSGLTASRLVATGASKQLSSVADLSLWIAGVSNRVSVTSDGAGAVTLSTPQDMHTGANPTFASMTLNASLLVAGIETSSGLVFNPDNTIDIGNVATLRPRTVYAATSVVAPSMTVSGLTPTHVLYAGAGGLVSGDAGMTYVAASDSLTVAGFQNVGTTTDAAAAGDFAAGLTGAKRVHFDQSDGTLIAWNTIVNGSTSAKYLKWNHTDPNGYPFYFSTGSATNPLGARNDLVFDLGYNMDYQGRIDTAEVSWGLQFETFYKPDAGHENVEFMLSYNSTAGVSRRPFQYRTNRVDDTVDNIYGATTYTYYAEDLTTLWMRWTTNKVLHGPSVTYEWQAASDLTSASDIIISRSAAGNILLQQPVNAAVNAGFKIDTRYNNSAAIASLSLSTAASANVWNLFARNAEAFLGIASVADYWRFGSATTTSINPLRLGSAVTVVPDSGVTLHLGTGGSTQGYIRMESAGAASRTANIYVPSGGGLQVDTTGNSYNIVLNGAVIQLYPGASAVLDVGSTGLTFADGKNIIVNATTGTKIGTATTQKLGFYNATPVVQGASVADASGGVVVDAEARTALNALISRIEATGLIATV